MPVVATIKGIQFLQRATKTEDGKEYPASAFVVVPDEEKPSSWKLRIWETPKKQVTVLQLGRAAAALSPSGFRGNRVELSGSERKKAKAKLRQLYESQSIAPADLPAAVKG